MKQTCKIFIKFFVWQFQKHASETFTQLWNTCKVVFFFQISVSQIQNYTSVFGNELWNLQDHCRGKSEDILPNYFLFSPPISGTLDPTNPIQESIQISSDFNPLPIAVAKDRTVILPTNSSTSRHLTNYRLMHLKRTLMWNKCVQKCTSEIESDIFEYPKGGSPHH